MEQALEAWTMSDWIEALEISGYAEGWERWPYSCPWMG